MADRWPDVVWLNGPFGVGKTTVAEALVERIESSVIVDPELIGLALRSAVPESETIEDFQDLEQWRHLTREAVRETARSGSRVIVPMTVVDRRYFDETVGLLRRDFDLVHVTLTAPAEVVHQRLRNRDGETDVWARERVESGVEAVADELFSVHVDAAERLREELADAIAESILSR